MPYQLSHLECNRVRQVLTALTHQLSGFADDGSPPLHRLIAPSTEGPMGGIDRAIDLVFVQRRKLPHNFVRVRVDTRKSALEACRAMCHRNSSTGLIVSSPHLGQLIARTRRRSTDFEARLAGKAQTVHRQVRPRDRSRDPNGRCQHPITSGTGHFAGTTGVITFKRPGELLNDVGRCVHLTIASPRCGEFDQAKHEWALLVVAPDQAGGHRRSVLERKARPRRGGRERWRPSRAQWQSPARRPRPGAPARRRLRRRCSPAVVRAAHPASKTPSTPDEGSARRETARQARRRPTTCSAGRVDDRRP